MVSWVLAAPLAAPAGASQRGRTAARGSAAGGDAAAGAASGWLPSPPALRLLPAAAGGCGAGFWCCCDRRAVEASGCTTGPAAVAMRLPARLSRRSSSATWAAAAAALPPSSAPGSSGALRLPSAAPLLACSPPARERGREGGQSSRDRAGARATPSLHCEESRHMSRRIHRLTGGAAAQQTANKRGDRLKHVRCAPSGSQDDSVRPGTTCPRNGRGLGCVLGHLSATRRQQRSAAVTRDVAGQRRCCPRPAGL